MQKNDFQSFKFIIECEYHCIVKKKKKKKKSIRLIDYF